MRYVLDTHTFLWWSGEYSNLSDSAYEICQNPENELFLSIASIWEMQIKSQLGKLQLPDTLENIVTVQQRRNNFRLLLIETDHIYQLGGLPNHHRDPFDRMLIAQALHEDIPLITKDTQVIKYPVTTVW